MTNSKWKTHTPTKTGDGPEGLLPQKALQVFEVEWRPSEASLWRSIGPDSSLSFLPRYQYRYRPLPGIGHNGGPPLEEGENPKARHGAAKPNLALIPAGAQLQIAPVFQLGAAKYGPYNWRKDAVEAECYVAACQRHLFSWLDGEDVDPESGELHLAHAAACLMILLDANACGKMIDNRPHPGRAAELIREKTKPVN